MTSQLNLDNSLATFSPDPLNPEFKIPRISGIDHDNLPASEQIEQMDQRITLTLQSIDADLSSVYNVILSRILPQIRNYGIATENSRKIAKYWKSFFEHAAQVRVPQSGEETFNETYYNDDRTAKNLDYNENDKTMNDTLNQDSFLGQLATNGVSSTPLVKRQQSDNSTTLPTSLESPFEKLRRQIRENDDDDLNFETTNSTSILPSFSLPSASEAQDVRADYSQVADESVQQEQELAPTPSINFNLKSNKKEDTLHEEKENVDDSIIDRSIVDKTPKKSLNNPFGGPQWNGIADLRVTPLRTHSKPEKFNFANQNYRQTAKNDIDSDDDDDDMLPPGMSPPQTMNFTMPKSKLSRTPAKEAAASIVDDILKEAGHSKKKFDRVDKLDKINDEDEDEDDTLMHQGSFMTRNYSKGDDFNPDDSSSTTSSLDNTAIHQPLTLNAAAVMANIQDDSDSDEDNSMNKSSLNQMSDASDTLFGPQSNKNNKSQLNKLQLHGDVTSTWFGTNINNAGHDPQSPLGN